MRILGISAFFHDSAAVLIEDGVIVAAAEEERFSRRKHDANFPERSVRWCLEKAGLAGEKIDYVAFYDKPFLKFERLLETYLSFAPRGFASFRRAMPPWITEKLFQRRMLTKSLEKTLGPGPWGRKLLFSEHHLSHAASAFFPSPFARAAVLTLDGVGEWATSSVSLGAENKIETIKEIHFPHSLGLLYSAFTHHLGFKVNSGEYKVMGLAPYGRPIYAGRILEKMVDVKADGSFRLNLEYFDYCTDLKMINPRFERLLNEPTRDPRKPLSQNHMDIAASIQSVTEEIMLRMARSLRKETGEKNLCLAGGVALNCVANGKIVREGIFDHVWIQPAAGDSGGALGAALAAYHLHLGQPRRMGSPDLMQGSLLGPEFSQNEIEKTLFRLGAKYEVHPENILIQRCVAALAEGKILGWFNGRMEFGPRALGGRSILADARSEKMRDHLNEKIKLRENFRPFAPSVLAERARDWFELSEESPYMLVTAQVKSAPGRTTIPAVTHVDQSARVQTVRQDLSPKYHRLLSAFEAATGCPVLVNTSFNIRGEPIVCSPEDAYRCFMGTDIDALAIGNCFLRKEEQNPEQMKSYAKTLIPD